MKTTPVTPQDITRAVWAVPPLARHADLSLHPAENTKLVRRLEHNGIATILYGGNAVFHHLPLSEYAGTLEMIAGLAASAGTWMIPSAGPDYGRLMDQAPILRGMSFPAVMVMPEAAAVTGAGVMTAVRRFADRAGCQVVLYLKSESYLSPAQAAALVDDGVACVLKYGISRGSARTPSDRGPQDAFLKDLLSRVDARRVLSGMGERPAIEHVLDYGVGGFTSGSVCLAPRASQALLRALRSRDAAAERHWRAFLPLEDLRDTLGASRVLHDAVTWSGLADMGPILPMLSNLEPEHMPTVTSAVHALMAYENGLAAAAPVR
jgi:dihydrodipicolinate synthase/N-acetylneuraminate lyase